MARAATFHKSGTNDDEIVTRQQAVCMIGLGRHGLLQAKALLSKPSVWSMACIVDSSVASYARFQASYHELDIPYFRTVADAMKHSTADAVVISTTAPSHVAVALEVISSNYARSILVEKPVSTSLGEAHTLVSVLDDSAWQGRVNVDFNRRCSELYGLVFEYVRSGELGELMKVVYSRKCKVGMKGSHYIDLANWFIGSAPTEVSGRFDGVSRIDHRGAKYFDPSGCIDVSYKNGVKFRLDANGTDETVQNGMTLLFERGEVFIDTDETLLRVKGPHGEREVASDKTDYGYNWFENTLHSMVFGSTKFEPCTIEEAETCLEVLVAAHISDRYDVTPVSLPLDPEFDTFELNIA